MAEKDYDEIVIQENVSSEALYAALRGLFPHGHRSFIPMLIEQMELHSRKNHDYASGGDPLGNFDRVSKILALYPGLKLADPSIVAVIYMLKQLDAALWLKSNGHRAVVQGSDERWADVSVYSNIIRIIEQRDA